jgi:amino acid transporter
MANMDKSENRPRSAWQKLSQFFSINGLFRLLTGKPRDLSDRSVFHQISLVAFLAWVGFGADGLSSSAYGPEEAFKTLGQHTYLAIALALVMAFTILVISAAYSRIIEEFPHGGGGYIVASKLLGRQAGLVSGSALLVDYVLTITISIAAAGDALFSFLPLHLHMLKLPVEIALIGVLTLLNIRGVRESVMVLTPIFIFFLVGHVIGIVWGISVKVPALPETIAHATTGFQSGLSTLGPIAMILLFIHAYSLGGGTYTGIEAVSNGLPMMREPRVHTAKKTMIYMALSLAFTASGLLFCYLLWNVHSVPGKTLNAVLFGRITAGMPFGDAMTVALMISEGLLLVVAAQAGFLDGPRVLANMAKDGWVPRQFASLSSKLTATRGVLLMCIASLAALVYTQGSVSHLVVMYSINVFLTFSLSIFGMLRMYIRAGENKYRRRSGVVIFLVGFLMCATILTITVIEKFGHGGWVTLAVTATLILLCLAIRRHYFKVASTISHLYSGLDKLPVPTEDTIRSLDPQARIACVLVGGYGGLGIYIVRSILDTFPGVYQGFVFISVGVVDSEGIKSRDIVEKLTSDSENMLHSYVDLAHRLGLPATYRMGVGTDVIQAGVDLCIDLKKEFPNITFFAGKIVFDNERWYHRFLHNETAYAMQKRLQLRGYTMVILPALVTEPSATEDFSTISS